jgi:hypothetical protein
MDMVTGVPRKVYRVRVISASHVEHYENLCPSCIVYARRHNPKSQYLDGVLMPYGTICDKCNSNQLRLFKQE